MSYTIIRVEKVVNIGQLSVSLGHNGRTRECAGANQMMTVMNEIVVGTADVQDGLVTHQDLVRPLTKQRNSVQALEYVIACPPEAIEALDGPQDAPHGKYLKDAVKWLSERHGGPYTVISAVIHRDEKSPHVHVLVVPIATKVRKGGHEHLCLAANHYVGGRDKLRALQTDFHREVSSKYGLERGRPKEETQRYHKPVREWDEARVLSAAADELASLPREDLVAAAMRLSKRLKESITQSQLSGSEKDSTQHIHQLPHVTALLTMYHYQQVADVLDLAIFQNASSNDQREHNNFVRGLVEERVQSTLRGNPKGIDRELKKALEMLAKQNPEQRAKTVAQASAEVADLAATKEIRAAFKAVADPEPEVHRGRGR